MLTTTAKIAMFVALSVVVVTIVLVIVLTTRKKTSSTPEDSDDTGNNTGNDASDNDTGNSDNTTEPRGDVTANVSVFSANTNEKVNVVVRDGIMTDAAEADYEFRTDDDYSVDSIPLTFEEVERGVYRIKFGSNRYLNLSNATGTFRSMFEEGVSDADEYRVKDAGSGLYRLYRASPSCAATSQLSSQNSDGEINIPQFMSSGDVDLDLQFDLGGARLVALCDN
jgi:5-hydroxyisourate hydrolase-like protein (transthyretin family)